MKKFNLYITFLDKVYIIESKIRSSPFLGMCKVLYEVGPPIYGGPQLFVGV